MVKSYLKYEHSRTLSLIASARSNALWCAPVLTAESAQRSTGLGTAVVGAAEEVLCWDLKRGELVGRWKDSGCSAEVTALTQSGADKDVFAAGYEDGSIRVWDSRTATVLIRFNGHKSAVATLCFEKDGVRLASGSRDTDIIVWDLVAEVGLFKLRGHKDQITGLSFLQSSRGTRDDAAEDGQDEQNNGTVEKAMLVSTAKDSMIKVWDIESRHCVETHVAQSNGECWALGVAPDQSGLITAGNEGELRFWSVNRTAFASDANPNSDDKSRVLLESGTIYKQGKDRTLGVVFHPSENFIAVHGTEKAVEIWRIRTPAEIQKMMTRKRKRRREKEAERHTDAQTSKIADEEDQSTAQVSDVIVPYVIVRTGGKVRSIQWAKPRSGSALNLMISEANNQIELWEVPVVVKAKTASQAPEYSRIVAVDSAGHRTDIRALALSSDDRMIASASNGGLKIWNSRTQSCIRTLDCGYALCAAFLPGDRIVVVGNRAGELELFDISSSTLIDTTKAHEGAVWTLAVHPDGKSMACGSADKSVKFFRFDIVQEEVLGTTRHTQRLQLSHFRTLQLNDDILSIKFSPDARLLAVSLLDNTVKVFFVDSLKLSLNLYGHKLPVLNMDISYDSKMIVTCSADKNIRLWGLDFGDCHKALFGHQDSVMQVAFIPHSQDGNGHCFFSASKDGLVKYWDGDKFEQIQKLDGHKGEIWAMAVSRTGDFLVSASHDKSMRIWKQTDEQIFLEEEREKELEDLYENTLTSSLEEPEDDAEERDEAVPATKQTVETLKDGEKIIEALNYGIEDYKLMREYAQEKAANPKTAPPSRNPIYLANGNVSAEVYLLELMQRIKAAALQDALLVLPFQQIGPLLTFLRIWAERRWNLPLTCRVLFFVLKLHHKQIVSSKFMRTLLDDIRSGLRQALETQKDEMGFNLAALRFIGQEMEESSQSRYIDDDLLTDQNVDPAKGKKKRGFVALA